MTDNTLEKRELYVFEKGKYAKVKKKVEGIGRGLIGMWALENTTRSKVSVMVLPNNEIEVVYIGSDSGFPSVKRIYKTEFSLNMDDYIVDEQHLNTKQLIADIRKLKI